MAVLIVNVSRAEDVRMLASVLTGTDQERLEEGNTLELTFAGPAMRRRIERLYEREFPSANTAPLPGQLPLGLDQEDRE